MCSELLLPVLCRNDAYPNSVLMIYLVGTVIYVESVTKPRVICIEALAIPVCKQIKLTQAFTVVFS